MEAVVFPRMLKNCQHIEEAENARFKHSHLTPDLLASQLFVESTSRDRAATAVITSSLVPICPAFRPVFAMGAHLFARLVRVRPPQDSKCLEQRRVDCRAEYLHAQRRCGEGRKAPLRSVEVSFCLSVLDISRLCRTS